jgi:hypothetical protein
MVRSIVTASLLRKEGNIENGATTEAYLVGNLQSKARAKTGSLCVGFPLFTDGGVGSCSEKFATLEAARAACLRGCDPYMQIDRSEDPAIIECWLAQLPRSGILIQ